MLKGRSTLHNQRKNITFQKKYTHMLKLTNVDAKILPYAEKHVLLLTLHMKYIRNATNTKYREEFIVNTAGFNPIGHDDLPALSTSLSLNVRSPSQPCWLFNVNSDSSSCTSQLSASNLSVPCPPRILKAQSLQSHDSRANRQVLAGVQRG